MTYWPLIAGLFFILYTAAIAGWDWQKEQDAQIQSMDNLIERQTVFLQQQQQINQLIIRPLSTYGGVPAPILGPITPSIPSTSSSE